MELYQYDSARRFRFRIAGALERNGVRELEHAWAAAGSTLNGRELVVDIAGVTKADASGFDLLCLMRNRGARLELSRAPESPSLAFRLALDWDRPSPARGEASAGLVRRMFRKLQLRWCTR